MAEESRGTVLLALSANLGIAIAKGAVGVIAGSSALLSEAAHSVADTINEVFLLTSIRRSNKPADERHPFGYGKERYFWSLLAAVGIFVAGALFSFLEGYRQLREGGHGEGGDWWWQYGVLAFAAILEGTSFTKSVIQVRGEAREWQRGFFEHIRDTTDPSVKTVFSEDAAALVGLALAAAGVGLHQATGHAYWDGAASLAIGALLAFVAYRLGRDTKDLLIGEAVDARIVDGIREQLMGYDGVDAVVKLYTMVLGAEEVLVAAMVDLDDSLSAGEVEDLSTRIDEDLVERFPLVKHVFLDATRQSARDERPVAARGERPVAEPDAAQA